MSYSTALLVVIPMIIAAGQILFKLASLSLPGANVSALYQLCGDLRFLTALVLYGAATVAWVFVIRDVPIGRAYLFMSLTFVAVPLGAWLVLGEPFTMRQAFGTAVIVAGILIAST